MKTFKVLLIVILLTVVGAGSCGRKSTNEKPATTKEVAKLQYTCPMHAEVVSDKPGKCPKCGMDLVEKK